VSISFHPETSFSSLLLIILCQDDDVLRLVVDSVTVTLVAGEKRRATSPFP
jgi:hypothetical protein